MVFFIPQFPPKHLVLRAGLSQNKIFNLSLVFCRHKETSYSGIFGFSSTIFGNYPQPKPIKTLIYIFLFQQLDLNIFNKKYLFRLTVLVLVVVFGSIKTFPRIFKRSKKKHNCYHNHFSNVSEKRLAEFFKILSIASVKKWVLFCQAVYPQLDLNYIW